MKLTRKEKDRIIKVLKKAAPFVAQGSPVCVAVTRACNDSTDIRLTKGYIMDLIYPRFYVIGWLYIQHGIKLNDAQAVEYRLAWVDHMIKELKK